MDLLETLIISSEKAANIARLLRKNEKLFQKLVEQKSSSEANPRFQQDFKTLADVLIQEMVKYDVGLKFPAMAAKVHGEESNRFFSRELNKEIVVEVKTCSEGTANLLCQLLDDDEEIAKTLAAEVHKMVRLKDINTKMPQENFVIDLDRLSIWIDPIDGTNEYVKGGYEEMTNKFYLKGLKCVSVLIGVCDDQGQPVIGVINQPFFQLGVDDGYQCHWGICIEDQQISSITDASKWTQKNMICIGGHESEVILRTLEKGGYNIVITTGAGYKLLTIILGLADAYVLSKPTTFFWDTCAPQAILRAIGGNIVEMQALTLKQKNLITYEPKENDSKCHIEGIIAYRNEDVLDKLLELDWTN